MALKAIRVKIPNCRIDSTVAVRKIGEATKSSMEKLR